MAIKKRDHVRQSGKPAIDETALEAFAASADVPVIGSSTSAPAPVDEAVAKSILIRWPNHALPSELLRVANELDRSQHKTALLALEIGLKELSDQISSSR